jgi:hypothetical protein
MSSLALDIGGANLKAADGCGWASSVPFPLCHDPDGLADALAVLMAAAPSCRRWAVTMTGELCDSFRTKAEGVRQILAAVEQVADGRELRVFLTDGRFVSIQRACESPYLAAASNWRALAQYACRFADGGAGLLIDVGSTTTDIIPLAEGRPCARGTTDTERLLAGELLYTGVCRTPICAVTPTLPLRGRRCLVAAEVFATTADVYLTLGDLTEQPDAEWTADGRPLTARFARERLARMVCADATTFDDRDARIAAEFVRDAQHAQVRDAVEKVMSRSQLAPECIVISGAGEFVARRIANDVEPGCRIISLAEELGADVSACAPAHALAVLAREALPA